MKPNYLQVMWGGVIAGALIACAAAASTEAAAISPILKPLIFPVALLLICAGGFHLFTGNVYKIGKDETLSAITKFKLLTLNYISNGLGVFLVVLLKKVSADAAVQAKIDALETYWSYWALFFSAFACNFLVCLGVKLFKISPIYTYCCVYLFVALGFEHSIADMYYFLCAPNTDWIMRIITLFAITVGNIYGGRFLIDIERILKK